MNRVVMLLALVACSSSPRSSQTTSQTTGSPPRKALAPVEGAPEPLPFTSECVAPADPSLADLRTRADAATKQGFEGEVARNKLRVLALGMHHDELAQGLQEGPPQPGDKVAAPLGTAVHRKLRTAQGTFVAAETAWSGNAGSPVAWEFVQDERGDVFRLIRKPRAAITEVQLCTCRAPQCGPYGSGCPACGSTSQTMYGPLPAGATYRGELELGYPANVVSVEYKQRGCPPPPRCPDPPP